MKDDLADFIERLRHLLPFLWRAAGADGPIQSLPLAYCPEVCTLLTRRLA